MDNLQRFKFHLNDALNILEAEEYKLKKEYDKIQEDKQDEDLIIKTDDIAESGVQLQQMIIQLKECLEFNF